MARHGLHDLRDRIELLISDGPALASNPRS
jgi:hypothetical protein